MRPKRNKKPTRTKTRKSPRAIRLKAGPTHVRQQNPVRVTRMKSTAEPAAPSRPNETPAGGWNRSVGAAVLIGVSVAGVLMLAAVRTPSVPIPPPASVDHAEIVVEPAEHAVVVDAEITPSSSGGPVPLRATVGTTVSAQPVVADVATPPPPAVPHISVETGKTAVIDEPDQQVDAAGSAITVTGCLERDDDSFRLTDTSGDEVPKARSWKSGFLVKRKASIALVDSERVSFPSYVGARVAVTGTLEDRAMRVVSLQRVGPACKG